MLKLSSDDLVQHLDKLKTTSPILGAITKLRPACQTKKTLINNN